MTDNDKKRRNDLLEANRQRELEPDDPSSTAGAGRQGDNTLTDEQITAGASIHCDHGKPIGRNVAIMVADAMFDAGAPLTDEWPTAADVLAENLENIAGQWDGCIFEAPADDIDIGESLRREFAKLDLSSTKVAALTVPAPLTDEPHSALPAAIPGTREQAMRDLMPKRTAFIEWCKARGIDTDVEKDAWGGQVFKYSHVESIWTGWFNAPSEAAPAPQQSELTDERIAQIYTKGFDDFAGPQQFRHGSNFQDYHAAGLKAVRNAIEAEVANKAAPAAPVQTAEPERMSTDEAREYLVKFMEQHFADKTFHRYIRADPVDRNRLAGDFAWQLAHALRRVLAAPVQAAQAQAEPSDPILATWPERIWLQWNPDEREEYPGASEDLTWCADNIHKTDVGYVRADLAAPALPAQAEQVEAVRAALDVLAERRRQVEVEGWTAERDDKYINCELARAAATYATCSHIEQLKLCGEQVWPWHPDWWKRGSYRRDLIKAGALILAEIERLDRAAPSTTPSNDTSALGDTGGAK